MATKNLFGLAIVLLALAVLVATSVAFSPVALARDDAQAHSYDAAVNDEQHTETFTVSSGGIDVIFAITRDGNGNVVAEARTWMLLPDEDGYRAYITEQKELAGDFVETDRGAIYDPDADGVPDAGAPIVENRTARLDER